MKSIKINKFLNLFNMLFVIVMSIALGISVYVGSILSKLSGVISDNDVIVQKVITYFDKSGNISDVNNIINSINIIYLLLALMFIFIIFAFVFVMFLLLSFFYRKANAKLSYVWSIISVLTLSFLLFFVIGQFSLNFFNILFFKNPVFIFINIVLLISLLVQLGFVINRLVYVYKQKGLTFEISSIYKILNIGLVLLIVILGFSILKNIIVLLFLNYTVNSIDFSYYLGVNEIVNYLINVISSKYGEIANSASISLAINFVKLTISNNLNELISYFIYSIVSKSFINGIIIYSISLITSIYLLIASIKFKFKEDYSIFNLIFCFVLLIFSIYLMFFAKIVLGSILGIIFLVISLFKLYVMYVKSDLSLMNFINDKK